MFTVLDIQLSVGCVISAEPSRSSFVQAVCEVTSLQWAHHLRAAWNSLIPLKARVWSPSDLFPCLHMFNHANQSAFNLNIHKPNLLLVFGASGSSECILMWNWWLLYFGEKWGIGGERGVWVVNQLWLHVSCLLMFVPRYFRATLGICFLFFFDKVGH